MSISNSVQSSLPSSEPLAIPIVNPMENDFCAMHEYNVSSANFDDVESHSACLSHVSKCIPLPRTLPSGLRETHNLFIHCSTELDSSLECFQVECLFSSKMVRVQSVLVTMNVELVKYH